MPYTKKPGSIAPNCGGYYEWLPDTYSTTKKYPLILFIHGLGELGNGSSQDLNNIICGLPASIKSYGFPYEAVVVCPQFMGWPAASHTSAVLDYCLKTYSIDPNRIYVTGLSMGGGATWDLASVSDKIAAIAPVCGAASPTSEGIFNMVKNNVAVWAFHAQDDPIVGSSNTHGWVDGLNSARIAPKAQKTIWPTGGHNVWGAVYDYTYKINGVDNAIEWLLKQTKSYVKPTLPTKYKITSATKPIDDWITDNNYLKGDFNYTDTMVLWGAKRIIENTTEQEVYQCEKFGSPLNYTFPLQNGQYEVKLHFAELWFRDPDLRIFNVDIQGSRVLTNFDIFKEAKGRNIAIQRTFVANVTDETLTINLSEVKKPNKSKITAIEIYPITESSQPSVSGSVTISPTPSVSPTSSIAVSSSLSGTILVKTTTEYFDSKNNLIKKTVTNDTINLNDLCTREAKITVSP
jgi:hypothetical protein